ncbi:MAG: hypothetical protein IMW90_18525 [Thermogemmatispora sp.]|uniref:hypothetical protein n=1 Tax=Thermogemmatispora sp. TaxID=1968838 RepID=UPI0019FC4B40|nr:hypothetical protein [Thermogemmatispora sp.]MBE3567716.1 hypothetical protein [Thermogemmatispora sp.]
METVLLVSFAIVNVIVTAAFASVVLAQYLQRHRPHQLYWSLALAMAFVATLAYVLMIPAQPTSALGIILFRIYYILGAALTSAWLGLGSIALVSSRRVTLACLIALALVSLLAIISLATAGVDQQALSHVIGSSGRGVLQLGAGVATIIILNTAGVVAVVGVLLYSLWKLLRRQPSIRGLQTSNIFWGNILILVGELFNAAAGSFARFMGLESTFWLFMALGWIIFFCGVLLTGRRPRQPAPASTATPEVSVSSQQPVSS